MTEAEPTKGTDRIALTYPFVLALYPPLALYAHNQRFYRLADLALACAASLAIAGAFLLPAALLWKERHERAFRLFVMVFFFHLSGHAASYFEGMPLDVLGGPVDLGVTAGWAMGLLGLGMLACRLPASGPRLTQALGLFSVVLVVMPAASITRLEVARLARQDLRGGLWSIARSVPPADAPHIFYVILDSYARQDVLAEQYGLDNTPFLEALRQRGFYVAGGSQSNYGGTVLSLASSLNMSYLDDLARTVQDGGDAFVVYPTISNNVVAKTLQQRGYSFVAFANGLSQTEARYADVFLDVKNASVADGKFFQTMLGLTPLRGIRFGGGVGRAHIEGLHRMRVLHTLETAPTLARSPAPVFALVHVVCPHAPFVFDRHGDPPTIEPDSVAAYRRAYADQVRYLNGRVLRMIDEILGSSSRPAVIVVQGDHGMNVGNGADEADELVGRLGPHRMKILNAYLFPDRNYARLYETITPVNTFRIILSQYFGLPIALLPDRVAAVSDPNAVEPSGLP